MSDLKQKAIENMIEHTKQGDIAAIKDLVVLLHPSNYSQKALMDIYTSKSATNIQREFISSQNHLFPKFEMQKSLKIQLAKDRDIEALAEIINILEAEEVDVYN